MSEPAVTETGIQWEMIPHLNRQEALYPVTLAMIVHRLRYMSGWSFELLEDFDRGQSSRGLTLRIRVRVQNSYEPPTDDEVRKMITVNHFFPVEPAGFNECAWRRWLLSKILLVHQHEACEFFRLEDSLGEITERPFAPNHGPGCDPYTIVEYAKDEDRRTRFTGEVLEDS